jgi:transcription antitermination factor NusG
MHWYAVRTLEGAETAVRNRIWRLAYPLLPTEPVEGPRSTSRLAPIFPEYLFLGIQGDPDWLAIRRIKGVIGPLAMSSLGPPYRFPAADIERLHDIQALLRALYREQAAAQPTPAKGKRYRRPRASKRIRARDVAQALQGSLDGMAVSELAGAVTAAAA